MWLSRLVCYYSNFPMLTPHKGIFRMICKVGHRLTIFATTITESYSPGKTHLLFQKGNLQWSGLKHKTMKSIAHCETHPTKIYRNTYTSANWYFYISPKITSNALFLGSIMSTRDYVIITKQIKQTNKKYWASSPTKDHFSKSYPQI